MRQARILDVVRAVTAVAPSHPEVQAWWYAPMPLLHLRGDAPGDVRERPPLEVVLEVGENGVVDFDGIAAELSKQLWDYPIATRAHQGGAEEKRLFRLLSDRSG